MANQTVFKESQKSDKVSIEAQRCDFTSSEDLAKASALKKLLMDDEKPKRFEPVYNNCSPQVAAECDNVGCEKALRRRKLQ